MSLVEVVHTDGNVILERRHIRAWSADETLDELNRTTASAAAGETVWRRPLSHSAPMSEYCRACGASICWCGTSRLLSRREV